MPDIVGVRSSAIALLALLLLRPEPLPRPQDVAGERASQSTGPDTRLEPPRVVNRSRGSRPAAGLRQTREDPRLRPGVKSGRPVQPVQAALWYRQPRAPPRAGPVQSVQSALQYRRPRAPPRVGPVQSVQSVQAAPALRCGTVASTGGLA